MVVILNKPMINLSPTSMMRKELRQNMRIFQLLIFSHTKNNSVKKQKKHAMINILLIIFLDLVSIVVRKVLLDLPGAKSPKKKAAGAPKGSLDNLIERYNEAVKNSKPGEEVYLDMGLMKEGGTGIKTHRGSVVNFGYVLPAGNPQHDIFIMHKEKDKQTGAADFFDKYYHGLKPAFQPIEAESAKGTAKTQKGKGSKETRKSPHNSLSKNLGRRNKIINYYH